MIAAVLNGPKDIRLLSLPSLKPGPSEAIIQVKAAGLCGTDYRIWTGERSVDYPRVMGHEFIGKVLAVGPEVEGLSPGQKVAVEPNYSCGECSLCREGNRNLCLSRTAVGIDVDGGFAQQARIPAACCWPAPPGMIDEQLLFAEPLAVVVRAVSARHARVGRVARPCWAWARSASSRSRCFGRAASECWPWDAATGGSAWPRTSAPTP